MISVFMFLSLSSLCYSTDVTQLQKDVQHLFKENTELRKKIDVFSQYCKLLPESTCGPCNCRDDDRVLKKYYCDCRNLLIERDCLAFNQKGYKTNGIYKVHQNYLKPIFVYCDQTTDGGGWTVFQRRTDGSEDFARSWIYYKSGFGQLQNEFWLGNEHLFTLTYQALYPKGSELRIDIRDWSDQQKYAKYDLFQVGNAQTKYQLHISGYSGTAGNSLTPAVHNRRQFTTFDRDNDANPSGNCATSSLGGWWYGTCHHSNLNGIYYKYSKFGPSDTGVHWDTFNSGAYSHQFAEMKLRRKV